MYCVCLLIVDIMNVTFHRNCLGLVPWNFWIRFEYVIQCRPSIFRLLQSEECRNNYSNNVATYIERMFRKHSNNQA